MGERNADARKLPEISRGISDSNGGFGEEAQSFPYRMPKWTRTSSGRIHNSRRRAAQV